MQAPPERRNPGALDTAGASEDISLGSDFNPDNIAPRPAPLKRPRTAAGRYLARAHPVRPALADLLAELAGWRVA